MNYNTGALLSKCLKSIYETEGDPAIEVFVADNGSTDGSAEMVGTRFPLVSLTRYQRNLGYTRAINPLLRLAKAKYYLLLHPDLELLPNTLNQFLQFFESHPHAGILGGNLYYPDGTPNPCEILWPGFKNDLRCFAVRLFGKIPGGGELFENSNPMEWSHSSTSRVPSVWNACMIIRREVLEEVGYFDEDFFVWAADWDLCKRAADAGWGVYYLYPATAIHHERQSFAPEEDIREDVRYKVDGWYSAAKQIKDRKTFLKKHASAASIFGAKTIYVMENVLRLWLIMAKFLVRKVDLNATTFQLRSCLQTIQAILKT